ncbi:MAG: hypothetical protein K2X65_04825, partial [Burkholderiaceae bacterium]|nr:hypothetical protein [Burkholderiaceae bacterium]
MARDKNIWAAKVFGLIKGGNVDGAVAQVKVAPTVADIVRLQGLLTALPQTPAQRQLDKVIEDQRELLA